MFYMYIIYIYIYIYIYVTYFKVIRLSAVMNNLRIFPEYTSYFMINIKISLIKSIATDQKMQKTEIKIICM